MKLILRLEAELPLSQRSPLCICAVAFGTQVKDLSFRVKFLLVELTYAGLWRDLQWAPVYSDFLMAAITSTMERKMNDDVVMGRAAVFQPIYRSYPFQ